MLPRRIKMVHTFAAIDVGSFELTMKIFEYGGKKPMKEIRVRLR